MLSKHTRTRLITVNGKKKRAHRVIMASVIGRELRPEEHIHHIDGNPLNNDPDNLMIIENHPHMILHKQIYPNKKLCALCKREFVCNPRNRKRHKCCSKECAQQMRVNGILRSRGIVVPQIPEIIGRMIMEVGK